MKINHIKPYIESNPQSKKQPAKTKDYVTPMAVTTNSSGITFGLSFHFPFSKKNEYSVRTEDSDFKGVFFEEIISTKKVVKDHNGQVIYKEYYKKSPDIPYKYNIFREDATGNRKQIGLAEKTPNGNITIEKNLVSPSGTKTNYFYIQKPDGGRLSYTKITAKDGKTLSENIQKFKVIDENHYQSIENGTTYDIKYYEDKVVVTRDNGNKTEISIGGNEKGSNGVISKEILELAKQLPGSIYFDITKNNLKKIAKDLYNEEENNATYYHNTREISLSNELSTPEMLFDLLHELGHYRDRNYANELHSQQKFLDTFEQERKEFYQIASRQEIRKLKYLIANDKNIEEAAIEIFAECHALMYHPCLYGTDVFRTELLQQYFPKSIAAATEIIKEEILITDELWEYYSTRPPRPTTLEI